MPDESTSERPAKRPRASRAGQEKRFECPNPGCGKRYSRAEHLQRHELNHKPREIYTCEEPNCSQTFVRLDLFARHKARHEALLSTRRFLEPRAPSSDNHIESSGPASRLGNGDRGEPSHDDTLSLVDVSTTIEPEISGVHSPKASSATLIRGNANGRNRSEVRSLLSDDHFLGEESEQRNDNFAAWLFESPGSQNDELNLPNLSFLDFGLEYSPREPWDKVEWSFNAGPMETTTHHATSSLGTSLNLETAHDRRAISGQRQAELISHISLFAWKQSHNNGVLTQDSDHILFSNNGQFPHLTPAVFDNLLANYWVSSKQVPIVHEASFSVNSCNALLLLAMIALGADALARSKPKGSLRAYNELGDLIVTQLRWELFTDDDVQPPVQLWAAQALVLVEFYEKQCSSRKLHERAHIHHASTLTLLRRGNPLIGRSGSESPTDGLSTNRNDAVGGVTTRQSSKFDDVDAWWVDWIRNESFKRVVFTAFQIDTLHAVLYGHAADMAANEIRLCLPCDDAVWKATSGSEVIRLEADMKMYGVRSVNFLEGLKSSLHTQEVQTHAPARLMLMTGLLSVAWHVGRREKHLQFLEPVPSTREQGRWRSLLLNAFGHWRHNYEKAAGTRMAGAGEGWHGPDTYASAPSVLFHLAHLSMHADIIDIQIYSGSKRLIGRKVSKKDYVNVVGRVKTWTVSSFARHAVFHSMKLLHESLLKPNIWLPRAIDRDASNVKYNTRSDPLYYRPWSLYLAALTVWAYQHSMKSSIAHSTSASIHQQWVDDGMDDSTRCCHYLNSCAAVEDPTQLSQVLTVQGCASILGTLSKNFSNAEPELLIEASQRLQDCRSMLLADDNVVD